VGASTKVLRSIRGRGIAMVYQDPMSALNPVKTIGAQLAESAAAASRRQPR
jgi:peptide/nickel transport system ATP-binding protein